MIRYFAGEYEFLSNFYDPCPVKYAGRTYRNSEAAYQAQKCREKEWQTMFEDLSPDDAKKLGRDVSIVSNWNAKKIDVMRGVVHAKFEQHPELATQLMETGEQTLIEGNTWHDNFWGVCMCPKCHEIQGLNWLGRILMRERKRLKNDEM